MCLMEATAYVAGEPHSDAPKCASPVLTALAIRLNDRWSDEERQLLAPLIPKLVGTRTTREVDTKRAYAMVDASIREIAPMGLEAVGWRDLAARMRDLAPVVDVASARAARAACEEIRAEGRKRAAAAAAADAAYAAADAAAAKLSPEERARIRSGARRPIVEATIRAFERVIAITA